MSQDRESWIDSFAARIDLIIARSPDIRRAGILSINIDGCAATFAPAEPDASTDAPELEPEHEPLNPWEDPASYPSGIVPTFEIETLGSEESYR